MRLFTLLFSLFIFAPTCFGQVYKWTDENGQTHFSQFPPEQGQSQQIKVNTSKASNSDQANQKLDGMRQKLQEQSVDRTTVSAEEGQAEKESQRMAENCKIAKQRLLEIKNNGRIYKTLENGEREWYDEKGRENLIKDAQKDVTEYCSK